MSSTTSRPAEGAPNPPVFSYAQAAKGRAASTAASAIQSSQTTSGVSTPPKDLNSVVNTPSGGSERGDRSVNGSYDVTSRAESQMESSNTDSKVATASKAEFAPASPSFGTASTSTLPKEKEDKEDDFTLVGAASTESARERNSHGGNANDKPEATEGRRSKKGKKQKNAEKEAEKEKEEAKQEVLVPAPLPIVNFWQQRKEEAAKAKPNPVDAAQNTPAICELANFNDTRKGNEAKKREKSLGLEEGDRNLSAGQNGATKDAQNATKGQKKGTDGTGKAKEDQPNKRAGPRGSRGMDKDEKSSNPLPPPVEDAMSWPTPETALEEEKRKAQEKSEKDEKDDTTSNKPRPKEKWVPVPYIPTVTFNTPMPTRGGRGRGGGRGGRTEASGRPSHTGNGAANGDKVQSSSAATTGPSTDLEKKKEGLLRAASLPLNTKRPANEQSGLRDQRKASVVGQGDKSKSGTMKTDSDVPAESRNTSSTGQTDAMVEGNQDQQLQRGDNSKALKLDQMQGYFTDNHSHPRSGDRRSEPTSRGVDQLGSNFNKDNNQQSRERADGRSDRGGRGAFRGRGSHNNFPNGQQHPQHAFTNGHAQQPPNGFPLRQSNGPYSPPLQQPPFNNQYVPPPARGGRGGPSRSQSIPNNAMYGRFPPNGSGPHMTPLQTSNPMFDYSMQSMSAMPYNPFVDNASTLAMVTMQLEYYFSIDNLCKDVYLRRHMDSQGFVFLAFIAGFKRIQSLTQEFEQLRYASQESEIIELVRGDDGLDRLRRKEGWEKWIVAMEDRDDSAKNAGPARLSRPQPAQRSQHMGPMMIPAHHAMSPPPFSPNAAEANFRPYTNGAAVAPTVNGNGTYHPETPLSAAVPDFAPGLPPLNGTHNPLEEEISFSDEQVAGLTLVFMPLMSNDDCKTRTPFRNASSRTFSNGSIDGRSIAEEIQDDRRQGRPPTNGSRASES